MAKNRKNRKRFSTSGPFCRPTHYVAGPKFDLTDCLDELKDIEARKAPEEIDPPLWAVMTVAGLGGHRHKSWSRTMQPSFRGSPAYGESSYLMAENDFESSADKPKKRLSRREKRQKAHEVIPDGNLPNDEYRFWFGEPGKNSMEARCKWCNNYAYGLDQRRSHMQSSECKAKMLAVFNHSKRNKRMLCMNCNKACNYDRWGAPLCRNSTCIGKWKFVKVGTWLEGWRERRFECRHNGVLDGFKYQD